MKKSAEVCFCWMYFMGKAEARAFSVCVKRLLTNTVGITGEARHEANPQPRLGTKRAPQQPAPPPPRPAVARSFRPLEIPPEGPIIPISKTPRAKPVPPTTAAEPKTRSYSAFRPARLIIGQTIGLGTVAVGSQTQAPAPAPAPTPAHHQQ